jgi:DNA-binding GntR family transcriptional regulator
MLENRILSDVVYDRIRELLVEGVLEPGQKVLRADLAENLGVSVTPVSQAISKLVGEGILEQRSRLGVFVKTFGPAEIMEMFELRAALESLAGWLAVKRGPCHDLLKEFKERFASFTDSRSAMDRGEEYFAVDRTFHQAIIDCSGNERLRDAYAAEFLPEKTYQVGLVRSPVDTYPEHLEIIGAFEQEDAEKVRRLLFDHFIRARDLVAQSRSTDAG